MSATHEVLLEQIVKLEDEITDLESRGDPALVAKTNLRELRAKFRDALDALNESKNVLKG